GFEPRIALLRLEPSRERLAIVVIDHAAQRTHVSRYGHPVPMAFIRVARVLDAIKNDSRRIKRSPQWSPMDAVDERRAITGHFLHLAQVRQLLNQAIAHFVISVKRENPFALNLGKAEITLIGKAVEHPVEQHYLRIARKDIERAVRATAVHYYDAPCPGKLVERAGDISRLIKCDDELSGGFDQWKFAFR